MPRVFGVHSCWLKRSPSQIQCVCVCVLGGVSVYVYMCKFTAHKRARILSLFPQKRTAASHARELVHTHTYTHIRRVLRNANLSMRSRTRTATHAYRHAGAPERIRHSESHLTVCRRDLIHPPPHRQAVRHPHFHTYTNQPQDQCTMHTMAHNVRI